MVDAEPKDVMLPRSLSELSNEMSYEEAIKRTSEEPIEMENKEENLNTPFASVSGNDDTVYEATNGESSCISMIEKGNPNEKSTEDCLELEGTPNEKNVKSKEYPNENSLLNENSLEGTPNENSTTLEAEESNYSGEEFEINPSADLNISPSEKLEESIPNDKSSEKLEESIPKDDGQKSSEKLEESILKDDGQQSSEKLESIPNDDGQKSSEKLEESIPNDDGQKSSEKLEESIPNDKSSEKLEESIPKDQSSDKLESQIPNDGGMNSNESIPNDGAALENRSTGFENSAQRDNMSSLSNYSASKLRKSFLNTSRHSIPISSHVFSSEEEGHSSSTTEEREYKCAICQEEIDSDIEPLDLTEAAFIVNENRNEEYPVCKLPCKHCFHTDELTTWFMRHLDSPSCPTCRTRVAQGEYKPGLMSQFRSEREPWLWRDIPGMVIRAVLGQCGAFLNLGNEIYLNAAETLRPDETSREREISVPLNLSRDL